MDNEPTKYPIGDRDFWEVFVPIALDLHRKRQAQKAARMANALYWQLVQEIWGEFEFEANHP